VPRQLPADIAGFTGRSAELATLAGLLADPTMADPADPAPVVVAVITGTAGVGKTALAVRAGHRLAERFPDGQLFIDLHGFTSALPPVAPEAALDRLLRALAVPAERIPVGLEDRAGLWRSVLAGRRMLLVLDNAATVDQVRPLLPGSTGCLVVVTSRRRLGGLPVTHTVSLDLLPMPDAVSLFASTAGRGGQVAGPPELVVEAVELWGRRPLAIRIAAARLASHPAWELADLVARLRDQDQRLAELADADGNRSVSAALEVSYEHLSAPQRLLYRRLGLHHGADLDRYATAALLDAGVEPAGRLLDQLLDAHLLQEPAPGRYVLHDLVRAHATHPATSPRRGRWPGLRAWYVRRQHRVAAGRLLDYYRHTAAVAMDVAYPYERERRPAVPAASTATPDLPEPTAAIGWLDAELPNLLATARLAAGSGRPEHTWHLSATLHRHLRTRGRYQDAEALHQLALAAARAAGHRPSERAALLRLGQIHLSQDRYHQASDTLARALADCRSTSDRPGELEALIGLGWTCAAQGRYQRALDHFRPALDLAQRTGDCPGKLNALIGLGRIHFMQDRYQPALDSFQQALTIAQQTGARFAELDALIGVGRVHQLRSEHQQALSSFQRALAVARETGDRNGELNALRGLGQIHLMQGRSDQALHDLGQALAIARSTGNRNGELGALLLIGELHRHQRRHRRAAAHYQQALDLARQIGQRNWQFEALQGLGRLHLATGNPHQAVAHHRRALQLATELGQPADRARAHDGLAHAHHALGSAGPAQRHWRQALAILTALGTSLTHDGETAVAQISAHLAQDQQTTAG
jgi:tetratricopeptide (TPR) repeat protein